MLCCIVWCETYRVSLPHPPDPIWDNSCGKWFTACPQKLTEDLLSRTLSCQKGINQCFHNRKSEMSVLWAASSAVWSHTRSFQVTLREREMELVSLWEGERRRGSCEAPGAPVLRRNQKPKGNLITPPRGPNSTRAACSRSRSYGRVCFSFYLTSVMICILNACLFRNVTQTSISLGNRTGDPRESWVNYVSAALLSFD